MKFILWSEFPDRVNWKSAKKLFQKYNLNAEIWVASKTLKEFKKWEQKIKSKQLSVGAWPTLSKKEGYWFSGFCSKDSIDKLNEFKGLNFKIDLETPFPTWNYSDLKLAYYTLKIMFSKAPNSKYLIKTIKKLSKNSNILINEFPMPKKYLKNLGVYYPLSKKISKNLMLYSTIPSKPLRPIMNFLARKHVKNYLLKNGTKNMSVSIGLINSGILNKEGYYSRISQFKKDLDYATNLGVKRIAIYSLDGIMNKGKDADKWVKLIKEYQK